MTTMVLLPRARSDAAAAAAAGELLTATRAELLALDAAPHLR
jgi:hypothetical protein